MAEIDAATLVRDYRRSRSLRITSELHGLQPEAVLRVLERAGVVARRGVADGNE